MGLREEFLTAAQAAPLTPVELPNGSTVWVRPMIGRVRSQLEANASRATKEPKASILSDARWGVIQYCLVDEHGEPLLTKDDKPLAETWNSSVIEAVFEAALTASNVSESDRKELEKN